MKKAFLPVLCVFLVFSYCSTALAASPQKQPSLQSPARELAFLLLSYGQLNQIAEVMAEEAMKGFRPEVEKKLGRELSRSEDEQFKVVFKKVSAEVYSKEFWVEVVVKVYSSFFSNEEIHSLVAFYKTEAGKKSLYLGTALTKELEATTVQLGEKRQKILLNRLGEEFDKLPMAKLLDKQPSEAEKKVKDFGRAIEICRKIQANQDIPISCETTFVEKNKPALAIIFQNSNDVEQYWKRVSDNIGNPFCEATNISSYEGLIILYIADQEKARIFECVPKTWTDWIDFKLPKDNKL